MGEKECSHHKNKRRKTIQRLCACLLVLLFIILLTFLIIWAVLQPKKPTFVLQDATIYAFNVTPPFLSSNLQATVISRNPNDKIGIYYDKQDIYVTYRSQQITYYTEIPPTYQGHKEVNVWSPFVYGTNVPVAPYNSMALTQDRASGVISLTIKVNGQVRWKVGTFISGHYHLHVSCPASIPFGNRNTGIVVGPAIKYQLSVRCSVNV